MKYQKIFMRILRGMLILLITSSLIGCSKATMTSCSLSGQADNFEKTRIVTVINTRTNTIIFRMVGTFSCQYSDGDLDIISAVGPDQYEKHFIHLNNNLTYIVEDTEGNGDMYYQNIEYFPVTEEGDQNGE